MSPVVQRSWQAVAQGLDGDFESHWQAYKTWSAEQTAPAVWLPSDERIEHSNLAAAWRAQGLGGYEALLAWSQHERAAFWGSVLARLDIPFHTKPTTILAGTATNPAWLPGARLNIAEACFTANVEQLAIHGRDEEGNETRLTYGQLKAESDAVSHGLLELGLVQGDPVALYMPMNAACVAAYLGIVQAGMAVVSIPDSFAAPEVAMRLRVAKAKAVITVDSFLRGAKQIPMAPKARQAAAEVGAKVIVIGDAGQDVSWVELMEIGRQAGPFQPVSCEPYDMTNILFSSGTTGEPKAIPWTHLTPLKAAMDGHFHQDIHAGDVVAWPTNIGWMMGPWLIYATLVNRGTIALYEGVPTGAGFLDFVRETKVSMLGLVPAIVRAWRESGAAKPGDLPAIRTFSSSGEASNPYDYLFLMSLANYQAPIIEYCGGTEVGGGHLTGTVVQPARPATFTTPALGLDFVVMDESGEHTGPDKHGQIFIIPPSIGLSQSLLNRDHDKEYYEGVPVGPEGQVLRKHGDEVHVLPGGFWAAGGRADDTMNLGGIKVSSIELEAVLNRHPDLSETAAVAIRPDEGGADQLVVFAVGKSTPDLLGELQARLKSELNPLYRIHDLVMVDKLPRTASNKVMRRELRDQYT